MTDEPTTDTIPDAAEIAPPAVRAIIDAPVMRPMTTPMLGAEPPTATATATPQPDVPSWMNTLPGTTPEDIAAKMRNLGVITAGSLETLPTQGIEVGTRAHVSGTSWDAGEWVWRGDAWGRPQGVTDIVRFDGTTFAVESAAQWVNGTQPYVFIRARATKAIKVNSLIKIGTIIAPEMYATMPMRLPTCSNNIAAPSDFIININNSDISLETFTEADMPAGKLIFGLATWPTAAMTATN